MSLLSQDAFKGRAGAEVALSGARRRDEVHQYVPGRLRGVGPWLALGCGRWAFCRRWRPSGLPSALIVAIGLGIMFSVSAGKPLRHDHSVLTSRPARRLYTGVRLADTCHRTGARHAHITHGYSRKRSRRSPAPCVAESAARCGPVWPEGHDPRRRLPSGSAKRGKGSRAPNRAHARSSRARALRHHHEPAAADRRRQHGEPGLVSSRETVWRPTP